MNGSITSAPAIVTFGSDLIDGDARIATLPQFDSNLGRLVGVTFSIQASIAGSAQLENATNSAALSTLTIGGGYSLTAGGLPIVAQSLPGRSSTIALPAFDGGLDFAGPGLVMVGSDVLHTEVTTSRSVDQNEADLTAFIGAGTTLVTFDPSGFADLSESNGNILYMSELSAGARVAATYTYVPFAITGLVYLDQATPNGVHDANEPGISGVTLTLTGQTYTGEMILPQSTTTGSDGAYAFNGLSAGTYIVSESPPSGYVDGYETRGNLAPLAGSLGSDSIGGIVLGPSQHLSEQNNFGEYLPARVTGSVYIDANNNGLREPEETGIGNVYITLSGTDDLGQRVSVVQFTDNQGRFEFGGLRPGTYSLAETQPTIETNPVPLAHYLDGAETQGNLTPLPGSRGSDTIGPIVLAYGGAAVGNNFGELIPTAETRSQVTLHVLGIHAQPSVVVLQFTLPLDPARARETDNYIISMAGRDGKFQTADDQRIPLSSADYDPASGTVMLHPRQRLSLNQDFLIVVRGGGGVVAYGQTLADGSGGYGNFSTIIQRGKKVTYTDSDGDRVTLNASRGGVIELHRGLDGNVQSLFVLNGSTKGDRMVAGKSTLSGTLRKTGKSNGRTTIPTVVTAVPMRLLWKRSQIVTLSVAASSVLPDAGR
jgi:protocatechuate 3,4-dioxygenase beta subunit